MSIKHAYAGDKYIIHNHGEDCLNNLQQLRQNATEINVKQKEMNALTFEEMESSLNSKVCQMCNTKLNNPQRVHNHHFTGNN